MSKVNGGRFFGTGAFRTIAAILTTDWSVAYQQSTLIDRSRQVN